jgi:hypothetical protein
MDAWTWLVAYLVGFALLQLVLYRYLQRGESTPGQDGETPEPEPGHRRLERAASGEGRGASASADTDTVVCQHCGTRNERHGTYSYCRECVKSLG